MGNAEAHNLSPVRPEERKDLNLSRTVNYKQYCKHVEGKPNESCFVELPWHLRDSISLYEHMSAAFNAITELPPELPLRLPHLNYIDLSHNQLQKLPDSFGLLFHLKTLLLKYNQITTLPDSFFHLVKLEKVDLSHNCLKALPNKFLKFESLAKLNVSSNKLKTLPISLGGVSTLKVLLFCDNRLQDPPEDVCRGGSEEVIGYLRKNFKLTGHNVEHYLSSNQNVFPRNRGNHLHTAVPNPHSAQVEYIQAQTHTANTASRIKTPLIPPPGGTALEAYMLRDRIIGLLYGAAIGDAIGLSTCCMSTDECSFNYSREGFTYTDIVQDELRVRWKHGDWTSNFDKMVLIMDSLIGWGGVVDELDYAKRLATWSQQGYPELGDKTGIVLSETFKQVVEHPKFLEDPHSAARLTQEATGTHIYAIENGVVHSDEDTSSISSELSTLSNHSDKVIQQTTLFPSSHPCIPAKTFGTDNGALVHIAILGVPYFHLCSEVEANSIRICKATHSHPLCIASCVVISNLVSQILQGRQDLNCYKTTDDLIQKASSLASGYIKHEQHLDQFTHYTNMTDINSINVREQYNMSYTLKAMASGLVALRSQQSYKSFMINLIMEGGDSNSNGCVAGALLGCKVGYSRLPHEWVQGLRKKQTDWLNVKINHLLDMIGLP